MKRQYYGSDSAQFKNILLKTHNVFSKIYKEIDEPYILIAEKQFLGAVERNEISIQVAFKLLDSPKNVLELVEEARKACEKENQENDSKQIQIIAKNTHWKSVYVSGLIMAVLYQPVGDVYHAAKDALTKHWGIKKETTLKKPANENAVNNYYYFHNECLNPRRQKPKLPAPNLRDDARHSLVI